MSQNIPNCKTKISLMWPIIVSLSRTPWMLHILLNEGNTEKLRESTLNAENIAHRKRKLRKLRWRLRYFIRKKSRTLIVVHFFLKSRAYFVN